MIGIAVVSHSAKLAEGLIEIAEQMNQGQVKLLAAGGINEGEIGTNPAYIKNVFETLEDCTNILVFVDLGSAILSTEAAMELIDQTLRNKIIIIDAPIVEATIAAVVQAGISGDVNEIISTAMLAKELHKL